jgi:hypothetical protein
MQARATIFSPLGAFIFHVCPLHTVFHSAHCAKLVEKLEFHVVLTRQKLREVEFIFEGGKAIELVRKVFPPETSFARIPSSLSLI